MSILSTLSGLGAEPAKPDFAFPKTVSKNAEADLKEALRVKNGPATVNALIRYSLARTAINPEGVDDVAKFMEKTAEKVSDPATKAMITLLRADMEHNDSLALSVWADSSEALKAASVEEWKTVVTAQPQFFPTLYDFAAAKAPFDSVAPTMKTLYAARPLPRLYWMIGGGQSYESLLKSYSQIQQEPESAYVLSALCRNCYGMEQRKGLYALTRQWIEAHGGSPYRNDVDRIEAKLCEPSMTVNVPSIVGKGKTLEVKVSAECLNRGSIKVTQVRGAGNFSANLQLKFDGTGVFTADTTLEMTFDNYGVYRFTPEFAGQNNSRRGRDYCEVAVSDMMLWREHYGSHAETFALDVINGAPQTDVEFSEIQHQIHVARGADKFSPAIYTGYGGEPNYYDQTYARVFTDRGIYHPGDSLRFVAAIIDLKGRNNTLAVGRNVTVNLYDANHQKVESLTLVSDNFGRVTGGFLLPKDGLTGSFSVVAEGLGTAYVTVTDYEAPTFEVKAECERLSADSIRVTGTAIGYNGFPIGDAEVQITVNTVPRWVWWRDFRHAGERTVATDTIRTDAEGKFSALLEIKADESLSVSAIATSPTGETHEDFAFVPFKPYFISAEIPRYYIPGEPLKISALNARGEAEQIPLVIELISQADSTRVTPDDTWANVPSGLYNVRISAEDSALAFPFEDSEVYVYRPTDKMPPVEMALFVPQRKAKPGDKLLVGTSYADSHILKTVWTDDKILSQEWISPAKGNSLTEVELPDSVKSATITFATLRNYNSESINVRVERPDILRSLNLKFSSFRDRMVPGERERWTITVADNTGNPAEAAVILDVYSKALDAIMPFGWHFDVYHPGGKAFNINFAWNNMHSARAYKIIDFKQPLTLSRPAFELYGRGWPMLFEEVAFGAYDMAMPMMMKARATMSVADEVCEDSVELCEAECASAGAVNGDAGAGSQSEPLEEFRMPEVAVAMWAPVLTTSPDGSLQVEFEAPNANTTWKVMCQAYDRRLLTGSHVAEIVAAKPVMVQPHLPRFLRVGDRTELRSLVMNATDSALKVNAYIEIFDPVTNEVFGRKDFDCNLEGGASELIALPVEAPDRSMLGVRVKAADGNFSDGEQAVIAILPAVVTARSATPLFLGADSTRVEFEAPRGSVVQVTTNAAWECVTALPGLAASESKSAFASTSALFSAAVGRGLVRTYPQIATALAKWQQEDSVLISKLCKNEDLKIALLSQTPWPAAAQSDTERMARLLLLLDRKEADRVIDGAIANLAKLVKKGGLRWTPDSDEPSEWVTCEFLQSVAQLRRLGYMPASEKLQRIVTSAVEYLDREVARDFAKYKGEYPDYAELRPQFPEVAQSAPARRAQAHTVQYLLSHWRDLGFTGQAQAALILYANGYQTSARTILESLRQYEAWRRTGLNTELLNAFAMIEPEAAEVDLIREFFIERKQAMDWGDGPETSDLIASILGSGKNWLVPAENQMVLKVNGEEIHPQAEAMLGSFRMDLADGGKIEMTKGEFPAWGGIFTSLTDSITEIPPFESEKLKITRRIEGNLSVGSKVKLIMEIDASQPLDYVIVKSPRAAMFSVVNQLPARLWLAGGSVYREPCSTVTNWFFSRLHKGKTIIEEDFYVTSEGDFLFMPAEVQSQYAPEFHSHTSGSKLQN